MDQVSQVREKIDIVSLISEYLPLKKAGRNFKVNCPFHGEKTPSFVVSPERQIWHCFGCNKGGDCFSFLMQYENLEFPEALRILARKAGIELERTHFEIGVSSKKEKIYLLNRKAMDFYHYLLINHNIGKRALEYLLKNRKIRPETINTFKLGFAPRIGDSLTNYLMNKKNYKKEDLVDAGLAFYRNGKALDFFANRIMFPLFDHRDNIIGFSGRVLEENPPAGGSKYVNTRETLVYHKGSVFFGLNIAKEKIKKENAAIIVEGEFDVISSFEEGLTNTIAVKGTALTENQVSLLSRFTQKVCLCFDQDLAGQEAIKRSLAALEKKELTTTVIIIPNAKDPDEAIKKDPISFKKAVKNDIGIYDFLINKVVSDFDKNTVDGKRKISSDLLPFLANIQNEIVKEHYFRKLAKELDTSYETIVRQIEKISKKETEMPLPKTQKEKRLREEILEEYLLALIMQAKNPSLALEIVRQALEEFSFKIPSYQKILDQMFTFLEKSDNKFDHKKFLTTLPLELMASFDVCYLFPLPHFENEEKYFEELKKTAKELKTLYLKAKIKETGEKIKEKEENEENKEELEKLEKELTETILLLQKKKI